ncbi:putative RNA-directed DNA polymerase, eukaryota, reverse transcriptase zinc-binding domain protein [Tanacetum coccineum]|uniref:RNA-directed DNA polymerase, eukaryota, reverse transcriptase zinc-binding domain protein n=1 Tax=Tanacetum coccineum TaxID=301880 RepID=A0ABQ5I254_9ASTR
MAFIKGRQIIDGPLIVDEIISWAKLNKRKMFFLKVDFEKAFDSLNWSFLDSVMSQMGFSNRWRKWIEACLKSAYASVLINGSPTPEFKLEKGLRQGDPLSPFLFILAIEALNVVLEDAKNRHFFRGIEVGKDKIHVSHLQFADDAIILGEWSATNVKNLSRILTCFHLASGLKVNFNKSKIFGIGVNVNELNSLAYSIGCQPSQFPCTYLGLPIGANMGRSVNWLPLVDRFQKRLSNWKSNSLSFGGRLTLIKAVLGSLGVYFFSTFKAPKFIINQLEGIRRKFFWGGLSDSKKIAWVSWAKVIAPLNQGGLNIGSLSISNQGLLAKWWWRFATENTSLWCNIIRSIHGPQGGLHDAHSIRSKSGPWYQIAKLNVDLGVHGIDLHSLLKIKVGNGESTRFWIDKWVGNSPLCSSFPRLFRLDSNPLCRVCERSPSIVSSPLIVPDILSTDQIYNPLGISIGPAMAETVGLFDPPDFVSNGLGEDL